MNSFQKNLLELISFLKTIEADISLINYEKMVHERPSETHEQLFNKIYQAYEKEILEADFNWLLTKDINISFGKNGKSTIRFSHFYNKANPEQRVQIEGLFINCLCECLRNELQKKQVQDVLSKYVQDEPMDLPIFGKMDGESKQLFGTIVDKLKNTFEEDGQDGANPSLDPNAIGKVVQDLMKDQELQQNIMNFAQKINLQQLLGNLFQNQK